MTKYKLKKGDKVQVISGKYKGLHGDIIEVLRKDASVVVSGVNVVTTHKKPTPGDPGGEIKKERPIHISNVMILDPDFGRPSRVGFKFDETGKKVRFSKLSGSVIG